MRWRLLVLLLLTVVLVRGQQPDELEEGFRHPPADAKPWVFWYWMRGAVSKEGISADLETMKEAGIGGAYLMPIFGPGDPPLVDTPTVQLSPRWWDMLRYAFTEADRLGLKIAMHASDGWSLAGGPWITPELSMQKITWSQQDLDGGRKVDTGLAMPPIHEGYYKDVAVYAIPIRAEWERSSRVEKPVVTDEGAKIAEDGSIRCDGPCWVQYAFEKPFTCRTIIVRARTNYQAQRLIIEASDDGQHFRSLGRLEPPRHGWQDADEDVTHTIRAVTARYFRFVYDKTGSEPGAEDLDAAKWKPALKVKEIELSAMPAVNQYEGKSGAVWRVSRPTTREQLPDSLCIAPGKMTDISRYMNTAGHLMWNAPPGRWLILRMGHTSSGYTNGTGGGGKGLECDKFNPAAAEIQFDHWFGETIRRVGPELAGRVLKIFHADSWECGSQNWSTVFRDEFRRRRGYDPLPWLPVMAGVPLTSADSSEKFLYDVRQTIAELIEDNFYKPLERMAHAKGCVFSAENVAPTMISDGMLHYQSADIPMGEFWLQSPTHDKPNDVLDAVSGAHIYGKRLVQAEAFTELRPEWNEYPGMLKSLQDLNYTFGINRLVFHVFVHNPWLDRKPGMTLDGIGTYFQREQTWWKPGRAWVAYTQRCQWLLQQGRPVADVAVFTGEEIPRRAVLPDRLVPVLPGLFGEKRVRSEAVRLANVGQPMTTIPSGVSHSANMMDPADWVNPLDGYAYDSFNPDALLRLGKVSGGRIVLPGGASYGVLVVPGVSKMSPGGRMSEAVADRLAEWEKEGARVIRGKYTRSDFSEFGVARDFVAREAGSMAAGIGYAHREGPGMDIYFVSNQRPGPRHLEISLRVTGRVPELWDAVTGEMSVASGWKVRGGRTELPLELAGNGSMFVVLRRPGGMAEGKIGTGKRDTVQRVLTGPWVVRFGNTPATFDKLRDWSLSEDTTIRYYSGTAEYNKTFALPAARSERVWLDLGDVKDIAEVWVNGVDCGVVWTRPFRVEITKALRKGDNQLRIEVTNTWANRLIGDHRLPENKRSTWTNAPYRLNGKLLPAGLMGEVRVLSETRHGGK
ncbi:MAG TPA: glycosyl hydrolase [Puia sp.]